MYKLFFFFFILLCTWEISSAESSAKFLIPDTTIVVKAGTHYKKNFIYNLFWGTHYRKVWNTPITCKVFDINTVYGGLQLKNVGGDLQSVSLKLEDSLGNEYVLKMVDKDQSKFLSKVLRKTLVGYISRDQTSALNPFGPSILSRLNKHIYSLDLPSNLYFVPFGTKLEPYLKNIKGRLGYLTPQPIENDSIGIIKTEKFLEERFYENKNSIDTIAFAEQRLFDFLIGDFDRHRDQWIWIYHKNNKLLIPLAKDHDMAFSKFKDGAFPCIIAKVQPILQQFNSKYRVHGLERTGRYLDRLILANMSRSDWEKTANNLIKNLPDSVLINAVRNMPDSVCKLIGDEMIQKLKLRRDQLKVISLNMYELLKKNSLIVTSDKAEKIKIHQVNGFEIHITIYSIHKDKKDKLLYFKSYKSSETKLIKIYSLGGNDEFEIEGEATNGIKIELYGGLQEDSYSDNTNVSGLSKKIYIFDTKKGNKYNLKSKPKIKLSRSSTRFSFDREGF